MRRFFSLQLAYVGAAHRAGAPLLAGTDAWNDDVFAGFGLHDELELFVEAGLSPLDALRTATSAPAAFFGREDDLGAIEVGYLADLVLLEANPIEDVANSRWISAVIANGRVYDRDALDELLDGAARATRDTALQAPAPVRRLVWIDRQGNIERLPGTPSEYWNPRLSPDGRRAAVRIGALGDVQHIRLVDLETGALESLTSQGGRNFAPVWSPDGAWIYFSSARNGDPDIWRKPSDGTGAAEIVYQAPGPQLPGSISPDGAWLAFDGNFDGTSQSRDIGLVPLSGGGDARLLTDTPEADEEDPRFSPDGRFIAFYSYESGTQRLYVQEVATGNRWRIPLEEGMQDAQSPRWTRRGGEIVFTASRKLFAVEVTYGLEPSFSAPRQIFDLPAGGLQYDATPDVERFLMVQRVAQRN